MSKLTDHQKERFMHHYRKAFGEGAKFVYAIAKRLRKSKGRRVYS